MMRDCTNAEMRDLLPDLLHERLESSARSVVVAHVDACDDCRDELQLLRDIEGMLAARAPRIDLAAVLKRLPPPPTKLVRVAPSRPHLWSDWRVAAAVTLLVAGGGSYALVRSTATDAPVVAKVASKNDVPPVESPETTVAVAERHAQQGTPAVAAAEESSAGGDNRLVDLSEDQLQSLLNDINGFHAVPSTEPEPVTIRVNVKVGSSNDGGAGI